MSERAGGSVSESVSVSARDISAWARIRVRVSELVLNTKLVLS